jgi:hypothetical protein
VQLRNTSVSARQTNLTLAAALHLRGLCAEDLSADLEHACVQVHMYTCAPVLINTLTPIHAAAMHRHVDEEKQKLMRT